MEADGVKRDSASGPRPERRRPRGRRRPRSRARPPPRRAPAAPNKSPRPAKGRAPHRETTKTSPLTIPSSPPVRKLVPAVPRQKGPDPRPAQGPRRERRRPAEAMSKAPKHRRQRPRRRPRPRQRPPTPSQTPPATPEGWNAISPALTGCPGTTTRRRRSAGAQLRPSRFLNLSNLRIASLSRVTYTN